MQWNKPSVHAANHRYMLGIVKIEHETDDGIEISEEMLILSFDGIRNGWYEYRHRGELIKLTEILWWYPIPELPKK